MKKLQLMAEKLIQCIGSTSGMGWEGKQNNKKSRRWETTSGMHHEQCHLYLGLWKRRVKILSSFWTGISCEGERAQFNERISLCFFFFIIVFNYLYYKHFTCNYFWVLVQLGSSLWLVIKCVYVIIIIKMKRI